jgi:hypothetical protein
MSRRAVIGLLVGLSCSWAPASEPARRPAEAELAPFDLVYRLKIVGQRDYYGSAILYRIDGTRGYFLTCAHLIPEDAAVARGLKIVATTPLRRPDETESAFHSRGGGLPSGIREVPARLLGAAPGHDVAVLEADLAAWAGPKEIAALRGRVGEGLLAGPNRDDLDVSDQWFGSGYLPAPVNVLGVADQYRPAVMALYGSVACEPVPGRWPWLRPDQSSLHCSRGLRRARLVRRTECPAPYLERCYEMSLPNLEGFSGGAVFLQDPGSRSAPIFAMVSHFSPGSTLAFAIPIGEATRVAERLLRKSRAASGPVLEVSDPRGLFTYLGNLTYRIESGPLRGKVISSNRIDVPGGGDASKGGGDASKGGGDASKGGGDASKGGGPAKPNLRGGVGLSPLPTEIPEGWQEDLYGCTPSRVRREWNADDLDMELVDPRRWFRDPGSLLGRMWRGLCSRRDIGRVMGYRPGTRVDGVITYGLRAAARTEAADHVAAFMGAYRRLVAEGKTRIEPTPEFEPAALPPLLESGTSSGYAQFGGGLTQDHAGVWTYHPYVAQPSPMSGGEAEVRGHLRRDPRTGALRLVVRHAGEDHAPGSEAQEIYDLEGGFSQEGSDTYFLFSRARLRRIGQPSSLYRRTVALPEEAPCYVAALLQRDRELQRFDLKLFVLPSTSGDQMSLREGPTPWQIHLPFKLYYLPLEEPAAGPR